MNNSAIIRCYDFITVQTHLIQDEVVGCERSLDRHLSSDTVHREILQSIGRSHSSVCHLVVRGLDKKTFVLMYAIIIGI